MAAWRTTDAVRTTAARRDTVASTAPVSLVIPTFNRAHLIPETITSLLAQTRQPFEIIVVDDGSEDDTEAVVRRLLPGSTYIRQENSGKAAALNRALAHAKGEYVWIFDDDDLASPDALAVLLDALERRPDCGFAYGRYENFGVSDDGQRWRCEVDAPVVESEGLFVTLLERCFIFQGAMLVRRSCFATVGPFDESLIRSQDYDMLLRLSRVFKAARVDRTVYLQRQHAGARGTLRDRVAADQVEDAWIRYDATLMRKILPTLQDRDYLPASEALPLSDEMQAQASVQKFTILARKDMWDEAGEALGRFWRLCSSHRRTRLHEREIEILARAFDGYSRAFRSFARRDGLSGSLARVRHRGLRRQVRRSMAQPLPCDIRIAIRHREGPHFRKRMRALAALRGPAFATFTLAKIVFSIARRRMTRIRGTDGDSGANDLTSPATWGVRSA